MTKKFDVFISHASEDKDEFVFPLADSLRRMGINVWYDEFELQIGDSLSRTIDYGLAQSTFGIVVISPAFLRKNWPEYELRGLVSREIGGEKVILPIWHNVSREDVLQFSPPLADKMALTTDERTSTDLLPKLVKVIRPDLHEKYRRLAISKDVRLKNLTKVDVDRIIHGNVRHQRLPEPLVTRIICFYAMTSEVFPTTLAEALYDFRCDMVPENEVKIWERIAACFYVACLRESFTLEKKRSIFSVLLAASLGPVEADEYAELPGKLSRAEVDSLIALYDSDLSALRLLESQAANVAS
jgi:TIR domain